MFKVICMKCGSETLFNFGRDKDNFKAVITNNDDVYVGDIGSYDIEGIGFECNKCGHSISRYGENYED